MPKCPRCGFDGAAGALECPLCRTPLGPELRQAGPQAGPAPPIAWEDPGRSFPGNLAATIRHSLFDPAGFFARVAWEGSLARPVLYFLLLSVASAFFTLLWTAAGVQATGLDDLEALGDFSGEAIILLNFTLSPFLALLGLVVSTLVLHLFVLVLAPGRRTLGATARAICYAAAPGLLTIVPWVGAFVGTVWGVVLLIFGVREGHRTTGGRAAAVVLIPVLLFLLLVLVLLVAAALLAERLERLPGGALPLP